MKPLVSHGLVVLGWVGTLVACYYITRWSSRRGYLRKDRVSVDDNFRLSPLNSPIDRIAISILQTAAKDGADTLVFHTYSHSLNVECWKDGDIIRTSEHPLTGTSKPSLAIMPFPPYIQDALLLQFMLLCEEWRSYDGRVRNLQEARADAERQKFRPLEEDEESLLERDALTRGSHEDRKIKVTFNFDLSFFAKKDEDEPEQKEPIVRLKVLPD